MGMKFTIEDIRDRERLDQMVKTEAEAIFNSPDARKNRSYDEIYASVQQGKVAELWLIENEGFEEADKRWHDLKDICGQYVEVKAYSINDSSAPHVQRDLKRLREEGWNTSKWYMLFKYDYGTYTFLEKIQLR
jgi:hypothetical protein